MAPDAKENQLLYVSDLGTLMVYVYSYPYDKLKGTLALSNYPEGECVDKTGDVFITEPTASEEELLHLWEESGAPEGLS